MGGVRRKGEGLVGYLYGGGKMWAVVKGEGNGENILYRKISPFFSHIWGLCARHAQIMICHIPNTQPHGFRIIIRVGEPACGWECGGNCLVNGC